MRNLCLSVSLVLLVLATGCSSNNKGKIEGTKWSSMAGVVDGNQLPADALGLEFGKDGSLKYLTPMGVLTGKYSLGSGNFVTLSFDKELAGQKRHRQKIEINGDKLKMSDSDGTSLNFKKVS